VSVRNVTAVLSGQHQVQQANPSQEIAAALTGTGPWTVVWMPGNVSQQVTASDGFARRTVTPAVTTVYTLSSVSDSTGCTGTVSGSATVTVVPPRPTLLSATAIALSSVQLNWSFTGSATDFAVDRCAGACGNPASWIEIGVPTTPSFLDTNAASNTSYLYRVRARKGGTSSIPSLYDVATTVIFGNDVVAGEIVDDNHVVQLRTAVQALSGLAGSAPPSFTGSTLLGNPVLAVQFSELRSAVTVARSTMGIGAPGFSSSSETIRALDINELRGAVR
jgi:hypothetical protein